MDDVDPLLIVPDLRDEAVFIASNVEDGTLSNRIGVREIEPCLNQVRPLGVFGDPIPIFDRLFGVGMNFPKLAQRVCGRKGEYPPAKVRNCLVYVMADACFVLLYFLYFETGAEMNPIRIGLLGFNGVQGLDLVGPLEAFMTATAEDNHGAGKPQSCYETLVIGLNNEPFTSETGIVFHPHKTLHNAPALDTLVIPGGRGARDRETSGIISDWISKRAGRIRRIASVCTGVYALAPTGLLGRRSVTTHWRFADDLAQRFPELKVNPSALFIKDGEFYTSAGITAGIDLSLALIEEDYGPRVALSVARELVVYLKRSGGQEQYSEPLQFQIQSTDPFADLAAWMRGHLRQNLSVEALAERARLCPRHFSRRFKEVFGVTPAVFVEALRLEEARRGLTDHNITIDGVGSSVGFKSAKSFRRAFERRFGITPGSYRSRFVSGKELCS